MPTDPYLLERIHHILRQKNIVYEEKKMFGGHCFMVDDKMCLGTYQDGLMARVGPHQVGPLSSEKEYAKRMIHGGRPMGGFIIVSPEGIDLDDDLEFWIEKCLDYNPLAKASKKRKKKV